MADLFDQLSLSFALQGGTLPLPPVQEQEETEDDKNLSHEKTDRMARALFTGFDLPLYRKQLARLHDERPLPEIFSWDPAPGEAERLQPLSASEKRIWYAFQQVLERGYKSGKYLQAMQELLKVHPTLQDLGLQIAQYLRLWNPEAYERFVSVQLAEKPDWRILRYVYAGYLLLDLSRSDCDPAGIRNRFLEIMQGKLELHEHLQGLRPQAWEVLAFYQTQAAWYLIGDPQLERALYAINVCFQVAQEVYSEEHPSEIDGLLQAWFGYMHTSPDATARMRVFLRPLLQDRLRRKSEAVHAAEEYAENGVGPHGPSDDERAASRGGI